MSLTIFTEISIIFAIAAAVSVVMRILKQPLIIGYIITGLLSGPYLFSIIKSPTEIYSLAELGIALLLFVIGLNLSPYAIKEVGKVSVFAGIGQVVFTSIAGYVISILLGFSEITSLYFAIALTLSSTIVVLKLLYDRNELDSLHGKITTGILIFQDIVASFAIIVLSSFSHNSSMFLWEHAVLKLIETVVLVVLIIIVAKAIMPFLGKLFTRSQEFLFIFTIGWGLSIATIFHLFGLSIEIGALAAGVSLAMTSYSREMSARMRPLRDFFIIIFFVLLGSQISFVGIKEMLIPILVFSLFVLVGGVVIVMIIMGVLGYRKRTSFLTGTSLAQISAFSLIILSIGVRNGQITQSSLSLITIVGVVTIAISSYLITYEHQIYNVVGRFLGIFEKKKTIKLLNHIKKGDIYDIIIFGINRIGGDFVDIFEKTEAKYLVVDIDPQVISDLRSDGVKAQYGDASDIEFLDSLNLQSVKMIISTIPDIKINEIIISKTRAVNKESILILVAYQIHDADILYKDGADYVIMPHFLGGSYASSMVAKYGFSKEGFAYERKKHISYLENKRKKGHEHPLPEGWR